MSHQWHLQQHCFCYRPKEVGIFCESFALRPNLTMPLNGVLGDPDRQRPAPAQPGLVVPPVAHPVPDLGNMVTAVGMVLVRHGSVDRGGLERAAFLSDP